MWFMHNFGGWWFPGAGILMLLVCIGIIGVIAWGITRLVRRGGCCSAVTTSTNQTPIDIAKERYAKGEITKEQFEQIKKDLS